MTGLVVATASRPGVGVPLGMLIGLVTGSVFLSLLHMAFNGGRNYKTVLAIGGEILALPTFWFGGPWLATTVMSTVDSESILLPYVNSLCITFFLIAVYPVLRLIVRVGNALGKEPTSRGTTVRE